MKNFLVTGVAAAAVIAGTAAIAQSAAPTQGAPARHAHNAQPLTRAAFEARVAAKFAKLDTNHDGFITKEEVNAIDAAREQKAEQRAQRFDPAKIFDRFDANHDGKITVAEVDAARSQRAQSKGGQPAQAHATAFTGLFARADTNKDNVITRAEFETMGQQLKARMERADGKRGGMAERMFETTDTNKDGRISLAEMQQASLVRFDRLDLNHDGTVTPAERQQARLQFKAQRQPKAAAAKH